MNFFATKKICFIFFIPIIFGIFYTNLIEIIFKKKKKDLNFDDFINYQTRPNSVLIAEYHRWHLECLPGYTKYFIDLGYNVDIIIPKGLKESMEKFQPKDNLQIFEYSEIKEIEANLMKFKHKLNKYKFSFLETLDLKHKNLYKKMGYFENPNSLFVIHHIDEMSKYGINNYISRKKVFSVTDYGVISFLNPNYFGEFNLLHEKNKSVSFFITSTKLRNYNYIVKGAEFLKNKGINFVINVIGRTGKFNAKKLPKRLKNYFHFFGEVKYQKMYEIIQNSNFIILNLFPNQKNDNLFRKYRSTGNSQLAYGFHKPVLIEENFAKPYKFSNETAIIFKGNDLSSAMLRAVNMKDEEYKNMCDNIKFLRESIYNASLINLKNVLDSSQIS